MIDKTAYYDKGFPLPNSTYPVALFKFDGYTWLLKRSKWKYIKGFVSVEEAKKYAHEYIKEEDDLDELPYFIGDEGPIRNGSTRVSWYYP